MKQIFSLTNSQYKYCLYDNGCHLDESIQAHVNDHQILKDVSCYIDKFHLKNHVRDCCHTKYNPYKQPDFNELDTQICEQKFYIINKHKYAVKHMSKYNFLFYWLCILDSLNNKLLDKMKK